MADLGEHLFLQKDGTVWTRVTFKGGCQKDIEIQIPEDINDFLWDLMQGEANKEQVKIKAALLGNKPIAEVKGE